MNIEFNFEGNKVEVQCNPNDKLKEVCEKFATKMKKEIKNLIFLYNVV